MVSKKSKNGIHLPISFSKIVEKHLDQKEFQTKNESIFVCDRALKDLIERSENDFQGRRLKQLILDGCDSYTRDWLQDVSLASHDYSQDLIFRP